METAEATNFLLLWSAATNFTPIIAAFLADSYFGRYPMIAFGSIASLL
ncbi:peptide/nitrate transporter, partial [Trifolium medium]|nr:peptide/nitrate transporter [Trifolium medium]